MERRIVERGPWTLRLGFRGATTSLSSKLALAFPLSSADDPIRRSRDAHSTASAAVCAEE
eukprot:scaffold7346_cov245-Pinguiococcus_pyrenoidosus.AAC.2